MDTEKLTSLLIDYLDGKLSSSEKIEVEELLEKNAQLRSELTELRTVLSIMDNAMSIEEFSAHENVFQANLYKELDGLKRQRFIFSLPIIYRVAAAIALVLLGVTAGYWINSSIRHEQELASLKNEMNETKQLMMSMLSNHQSASQRMQGVGVALSIANVDDEVVETLANTMISDDNTNVRLAALEALSQFISEPQVKQILIASLSKQDDPVVQIALIQLLVKIKERDVLNDLEKIIQDEKSMEAVKDEAYSGILKLS